MFSCGADDGFISWYYNGTVLEDIPSEIRNEIDTRASGAVEELIIPPNLAYSGTTVQCIAVMTNGSSAKSDVATLHIQGIL